MPKADNDNKSPYQPLFAALHDVFRQQSMTQSASPYLALCIDYDKRITPFAFYCVFETQTGIAEINRKLPNLKHILCVDLSRNFERQLNERGIDPRTMESLSHTAGQKAINCVPVPHIDMPWAYR